MKEAFKKLFASKSVRAAFVSLLLAVAAVFGYSQSGCAVFKGGPDAQRARVDKFKCQVAAFAPLTDGVLDAEQLVLDFYAGKGSLSSVLGNLDATPAEVKALSDRLQKCEPAPASVTDGSAS